MPILTLLNHSYSDDYAVDNVVDYACRKGSYITGYAVDPWHAIEQMEAVKQIWCKNRGRRLIHFLLSFSQHEVIGDESAIKLGYLICEYHSRFQSVCSLHYDSGNKHLHFVMNTVSFIDGSMYAEGKPDWFRLRNYINEILPQWETVFEIKSQ